MSAVEQKTAVKNQKIYKIKNTFGISVEQTFNCGQCFRFEKVVASDYDAEYRGVAYGRSVSFAEKGGDLYVIGSDEHEFESLWRGYLDLDTDYAEIHRQLASLSPNPMLRKALEQGRGIRILKQEPWEAVCSFIISQNNNIPRIKRLVAALCRRAGKEISDGVFAFPTPSEVAALGTDELRLLKVGFRAPYIADAAQKFADGVIDPESIFKMNTADAQKLLCSVKGIGPKVACCSLLFGFSKYDAFPVDVWIKRVLQKYFEPDFNPSSLGKYAGVAQQVLFLAETTK